MVTNAHPILRMFQFCEMMKWNHLPVHGGIYDQDPDLLDGFLVIFSERNKYEAEKERQDNMKNNRAPRNPRLAGRR